MPSSHPVTSRWARVARLTRKELSEVLRDRRTIVTLVAMPLLLYPLLSIAFLQFAWLGKADARRDTTYLLGFVNPAEADVFLARLAQAPADERASAPKLEARLATPEELE